ncbi:MAG: hypothetical protein H7Z11_08915 [Verrucomicrobia bacterium]|nr:hypothetical protein [Leptolyngbya sp. ES-bin-22]
MISASWLDNLLILYRSAAYLLYNDYQALPRVGQRESFAQSSLHAKLAESRAAVLI